MASEIEYSDPAYEEWLLRNYYIELFITNRPVVVNPSKKLIVITGRAFEKTPERLGIAYYKCFHAHHTGQHYIEAHTPLSPNDTYPARIICPEHPGDSHMQERVTDYNSQTIKTQVDLSILFPELPED
jgi:hypothetical protein